MAQEGGDEGALPAADRHSISFASEAAQAIDYYYVGGENMDEVISGYRQLTGKSVMMPKVPSAPSQSRAQSGPAACLGT